eukprot:287432_1
MLKKVPSGCHQLTPLNISTGTVPNYTKLDKTKNEISITNSDLSLFTFDQWNFYLSRTIIYPFATVFALEYNMTPSTFSFIMSAFDFGGCIAVILTLLPTFNRIPIRYCMFILLISASFLNLGMTFWTSFIALFIVRFLTGICATIGSAQIRGTLGATLKNKDNTSDLQSQLTCGIMLIESAWSTATFGWMFIGIGMHRVCVNFAWYIISATTLIASGCCYFLPVFSIYEAKPPKKQIMFPPNNTDGVIINNNNQNPPSTVNLKKMLNALSFTNVYDLYVLYLGMFVNGIPFYCFFSTFGGFMQNTFNLNAEELGGITLTITAGEVSALLSSSFIAKYKSNMFIVIVGSCCGLVVFSAFVIMLNFELLSMISAMVILYLFTYTIELSYLNSIVCTLHFAPEGYEGTASLIGQFVSRSSSIFSVIMGVHIVDWMGFEFLIELLIIAQFISIVIFWYLYKLYQMKKQSELDEKNEIV